jgi:hypothetical protein
MCSWVEHVRILCISVCICFPIYLYVLMRIDMANTICVYTNIYIEEISIYIYTLLT